jgi:hypothetical protein
MLDLEKGTLSRGLNEQRADHRVNYAGPADIAPLQARARSYGQLTTFRSGCANVP